MGIQGLMEVAGKTYRVNKRFIHYNGHFLCETDDLDLPRDEWGECELIADSGHGRAGGILVVGPDSDRTSVISAVLEQTGIGHGLICIDEASGVDFVGAELALRNLPDLRMSESVEGLLTGKKGRRRGQRKSEQRRTEKWKRG